MSFNSTLTILPCTAAATGLNGVILPQTSRILFESDIDLKIREVRARIDRATNAQRQKNTRRGAKIRKIICEQQTSMKDQMDSFSQRLALLEEAKKIIESLNFKGLNFIKNLNNVTEPSSKPTVLCSEALPISISISPETISPSVSISSEAKEVFCRLMEQFNDIKYPQFQHIIVELGQLMSEFIKDDIIFAIAHDKALPLKNVLAILIPLEKLVNITHHLIMVQNLIEYTKMYALCMNFKICLKNSLVRTVSFSRFYKLLENSKIS